MKTSNQTQLMAQRINKLNNINLIIVSNQIVIDTTDKTNITKIAKIYESKVCHIKCTQNIEDIFNIPEYIDNPLVLIYDGCRNLSIQDNDYLDMLAKKHLYLTIIRYL